MAFEQMSAAALKFPAVVICAHWCVAKAAFSIVGQLETFYATMLFELVLRTLQQAWCGCLELIVIGSVGPAYVTHGIAFIRFHRDC